ncbi:MAG: hypothetical protein HY951_13155 [Bacteroidia bacterium]|nr:hypothetical protein [Bacteroidia bacterium]
MTKEEKLYNNIGQNLKDAVISQMFGKPCLKINGKAFACFFENEMVFKLTGEAHKEAINLKGSKLFDPSGKNRPMKEWVQVSAVNSEKWQEFARLSFEYIK